MSQDLEANNTSVEAAVKKEDANICDKTGIAPETPPKSNMIMDNVGPLILWIIF